MANGPYDTFKVALYIRAIQPYFLGPSLLSDSFAFFCGLIIWTWLLLQCPLFRYVNTVSMIKELEIIFRRVCLGNSIIQCSDLKKNKYIARWSITAGINYMNYYNRSGTLIIVLTWSNLASFISQGNSNGFLGSQNNIKSLSPMNLLYILYTRKT